MPTEPRTARPTPELVILVAAPFVIGLAGMAGWHAWREITCAGTRLPIERRLQACTAAIDSRWSIIVGRALLYEARGSLFEAKGDHRHAIEDLNEAIRLKPRANAITNRGLAYTNMRDYARAIDDFDRAIELEAGNAGFWNNRCWARALAGRLEDALRDCEESLRLGPGEPSTLDSRALVYLKSGRPDLALADYDTALRRNPRLATSLYGRGLAKERGGDAAGAADDIAAATALDRDVARKFVEDYGVPARP